jgi:SAM-dependent methyltransferase
MMPDPIKANYAPGVFETANLDAAKAIILTPEVGTTTEERWRVETPYLVDQMAERLKLDGDSLVLDYGCGIGRLSKALIERTGCFVIGVDMAQRMREMSVSYVASPYFIPVSLRGLDALVARGLKVDFALASWVLQHCLNVERDVNRIAAAMKPAARLFMVNNIVRAVPTDRGWVNDGKNIEALLSEHFDALERYRFAPGISTPELTENSALSWWCRK